MAAASGGSGTASYSVTRGGGRRGDGSIGGETRAVRTSGGRRTVSVARRRLVLEESMTQELVTLYGGLSVQHLGGTPGAQYALNLLQGFVWAHATKESRNAHMTKFKAFCMAEKRGMPPDEVDLVCFVGYLIYEGKVSANSFAQYLSGVRRFCEVMGLSPLPPTPGQSTLLRNALQAAKRMESEMPVKDVFVRMGLSALQAMTVLHTDPDSNNLVLLLGKLMTLVLFCFSFRGGTCGALWCKDFVFTNDFSMYVTPDVLKRTSSDCTRNPTSRPYSVPLDTVPENNPIIFMRKVVELFGRKYGTERFLFSPDGHSAGSPEYISAQLSAMAASAGLVVPEGMKMTSHSPRRGMLTEFVLQSPRPDNIVIAGRMDWSPKSELTLTYFSKNVVKSWASAILVPGALQMQPGLLH